MVVSREQKEAREARDLAPWGFPAALSRGRATPEDPDALRTVFERDRDRIIHSRAFRRLDGKTQVFVSGEGDYYRTRLTHSLEVMQVGRSVACALGANETLTEVLCLAHDIGHPPYGHSGEDALDTLMEGRGGFRHNLQALRLVDLIERRSPRYRGLNLSWEVRASLLKKEDPGDSDLAERGAPLVEAQIADLADSTAYTVHDLDDGLKAGVFPLEAAEDTALWQRAAEHARTRSGEAQGRLAVGRVLNSLLKITLNDLIEQSELTLRAIGIGGPEDVATATSRLVGHSDELAPEVGELHAFLRVHFYDSTAVRARTDEAEEVLGLLTRHYRAGPDAMTQEFQDWAGEAGLERAVCDYIAGMTDPFARDQFQRFQAQ